MAGEIRCSPITIIGDDSIENIEYFTVEFTPLNPLDQFYNATSTEVSIHDNDGKFTFTYDCMKLLRLVGLLSLS